MNTTIVKPKSDAEVALTPRQERKIYNRTKYRLNKRRNLWLRSIAAAKDLGGVSRDPETSWLT